MMEDSAGSLETLHRLKKLATTLLIDDFGTGYSSLGYLQKLPVDAGRPIQGVREKKDRKRRIRAEDHRDSGGLRRRVHQDGNRLD
jgi:hypothetical protein